MTKPSVLLHALPPHMVATLEDAYEVHKASDFADIAALASGPVRDVEVLVTDGRPLPNAMLAALPNLKLVACFSTGYGGIDWPWLKAHGIALTNAAGVNAHDVADHAVALALSGWHGVLGADAAMRAGGWREALKPRRSLKGRRAGVVGLGRIGMAIAKRLAAHELEIGWWGPNAKPDSPYRRADDLVSLARDSDILVVASRAMPANKHQVNRAVIEALGPQGLLVNISRGFLIDEDAMIACLKNGALGGAALDVFEQEPTPAARWRDVPNVTLTPHIAGFTAEAGPSMLALLMENVRRHFASEPLLTPVT